MPPLPPEEIPEGGGEEEQPEPSSLVAVGGGEIDRDGPDGEVTAADAEGLDIRHQGTANPDELNVTGVNGDGANQTAANVDFERPPTKTEQ